jgi:drug/metabolite transporter (DMT)-like permease
VLAGAYLAVAVTAVAFVLWYTCVERLGSARAGLLTGIAPIAAATTGIVLGGPIPGVLVWLGVAVVAGGLAFGLQPSTRPSSAASTARPAQENGGSPRPIASSCAARTAAAPDL